MILQIYLHDDEYVNSDLPVRLGALFDGTLVVTRDLGSSTTMPLAFLLCNIEGHAKSLLVFPLIRLYNHSVISILPQAC
jgi:hypothetical protein